MTPKGNTYCKNCQFMCVVKSPVYSDDHICLHPAKQYHHNTPIDGKTTSSPSCTFANTYCNCREYVCGIPTERYEGTIIDRVIGYIFGQGW